MKYSNLSINMYLNKLAAKAPTPGGGSSAAVFGAMGCALLEMVINYSNKNTKTIKNSGIVLKKYRIRFLHLLEDDIRVYKKLSSVCKNNKNNSKIIQISLKKAALVPLDTCAFSYAGVKLCNRLKTQVNKNLISDLGCAKEAFVCAFNSAKLNVDINLKYIKDKAFVNLTRKKLKKWRRF